MKIKTSELKDQALDWAVARCVGGKILIEVAQAGVFLDQGDGFDYFTPSRSWEQGGPIIEREGITVSKYAKELEQPLDKLWFANTWDSDVNMDSVVEGPTPLIAAMRCYVVSKLGDEVDVPEELCGRGK